MANASKISIDGTVYDLRDPTKAPNTVVSKTANGLCPQLPNESTTTKYLRQDGNWVVPPNTTYSNFTRSSNGLCPQAPSGSGTTKYLREDGTWNVPPNTTYNVVAKGSNGLCPALPNESTTTKYLRQDGTWVVPPNTTYGVVSKTANGLCPKLPNETTTTKYLRQDGTWVVPPNTTYGVVTTSANGLCPQLAGGTTKYLRADGTWVAPPNTTYGVVSKTANGLCPQLPNETTTTKYLRQDGTWVVPPNTTTGTTYTPTNLPSNTTFATQGSVKNVYNLISGIGAHFGTTTTENVSSAGWHGFTNKLSLTQTGWYIVFVQCLGGEVGITGLDYTGQEGYCDGNFYMSFIKVTSAPKTITGYGYFTQAKNNAYCHLEALKICNV